MKKKLAIVLSLALLVALLMPVAAFAGSKDTYTVSLKLEDGTNSYALGDVKNILGSATLKEAIGAQVAAARDKLKETFPDSKMGATFDHLIELANDGPDEDWAEKINSLTVTPAAAVDVLAQRDATVAALDAASEKGTITLALGEDYTVTLSFKITTPYYTDPDPTPAGGGTATTNNDTYTPEVAETEHGAADVSTEAPKAGEEVAVTLTPDEGYQVARVIVTDADGNKVEMDYKSAQELAFTQPEGSVKIEAVFAPIGEPVEVNEIQPSPQALTVDDVQQDVHAYNIDGANFVQLRDLAAMLNGTEAQFDVTYDAANNRVVITTGKGYAGTVSSDFSDKSDTAVPSPQSIMIDGRLVQLSAVNIGGNNFFKLRDLAPFFGFSVDYNSEMNAAQITSK